MAVTKGLLYGNWNTYLNETHSYWLGWYTITYRNGTVKYFSYYLCLVRVPNIQRTMVL